MAFLGRSSDRRCLVMHVENSLAELPESLVWTDELTCVRLHEKRKRLSGDTFCPLPCSHADAVGSRAQSSTGRKLKRLTRLKCETVDRNGNLREIASTRPDIQPGLWGRRLYNDGFLARLVREEHSL